MKHALIALAFCTMLGCGGDSELTGPTQKFNFSLQRDLSGDAHYSPASDTLYVAVQLVHDVPLSSGFATVAVPNAMLIASDTLVVPSSLRTDSHGRAEIVWRRESADHCDGGTVPGCSRATLTLSYDSPSANAPVSLTIPDSGTVTR